VTALVFAKLFFPKADPITGVTDAFAIYFIGFAARPVGAWLFGTYGDRIGRKATLIATLLLMGIATFLIGVLPTHAQIGVWAAVLLTALRLCQGLGVGGEWGGSVLMSMEDRKSTRLNSSHSQISYAVFCLKKKKIHRSIAGFRRHGATPTRTCRACRRQQCSAEIHPHLQLTRPDLLPMANAGTVRNVTQFF